MDGGKLGIGNGEEVVVAAALGRWRGERPLPAETGAFNRNSLAASVIQIALRIRG